MHGQLRLCTFAHSWDCRQTVFATRSASTRSQFYPRAAWTPTCTFGYQDHGRRGGKLGMEACLGEYDVLADPTEGGAAFVRTKSSFRVDEHPADQSLEVRVKRGCVLILEVVDAKTGKGIPGIQFMGSMDGNPRARTSVQSRTVYFDYWVSDTNGCEARRGGNPCNRKASSRWRTSPVHRIPPEFRGKARYASCGADGDHSVRAGPLRVSRSRSSSPYPATPGQPGNRRFRIEGLVPSQEYCYRLRRPQARRNP